MVLVVVLSLLSSCIREEETTNSPKGNFEALWKLSMSSIVSWNTSK